MKPLTLRTATIILASALLVMMGDLSAANLPPGFAPRKDFTPATLGPKEPQLSIPFPGAAMTRGVVRGTARVAVLVDPDGKPVDYLVTACADPAFGAALREDLQHRSFKPATFKNVPVSGRADIAYWFERSSALSPTEEIANRTNPRAEVPAYSAQSESKLDHDLEIASASLPLLPPELAGEARSGHPVRVFVTFFVDEQGHVRTPEVESASSPLLVPHAVRVVQKWTFKPPTIKGKPVLVFTGRPVHFLTEEEARKMGVQ